MCRRWAGSFAAFYADMGDPPTGLSIDRIDNNAHYSCGRHDLCEDCRERGLAPNCRWAAPKEQANNTRKNLVVAINGGSETLSRVADRTGLNYARMRERFRQGRTDEEVVATESFKTSHLIEGPDGTVLRLTEWAKRTGIAAATILTRIDDGWSPAYAATTPRTHRFYPAARKR